MRRGRDLLEDWQGARAAWLTVTEVFATGLPVALLVGAAIKRRLVRVRGQENRNTAALTAQVHRPWGSHSVAAVIDRLSITKLLCS